MRRPASASPRSSTRLPTDLTQAGQAQPLAVFEREFAIGVGRHRPANAAPGEVVVPARLRYQACDAQLCYAPTTVSARMDAPRRCQPARRSPRSRRRLQARLRSATDEAAGGRTLRVTARAPGGGGRRNARPRGAGRLHGARRAGGYLRSSEFLQCDPRRRSGVEARRPVRGPRTAGDPPGGPGRRARAQPDAVRAADDSDQPGDHRRRRAGRLARPRVPARLGLRRAPWRSSTACSA